jgi:hypothetical protein
VTAPLLCRTCDGEQNRGATISFYTKKGLATMNLVYGIAGWVVKVIVFLFELRGALYELTTVKKKK